MNISTPQINELAGAVRLGLVPLSRPVPMTAVEWADGDEGFYLSSESSYQEGKWETLPFQVAILNAMGNDEIRTVNVIKSARVGYSKMLLAASAYQIEHKRRNILLLLPTDGAAAGFMKAHVETMIRDVPSIYALAPWYGKKHRDNTLDTKRFSHSKQLWCLGGAAAKNYREKSVDTIIYDELAAFEPDVEKEGSPTFLGDKRIEGSTFPKSIRGSTPKIKGTCQIEAAASESPHLFRLHVPCPHCQAEQFLKWGGKDCAFGIKWDAESPGNAWYVCEHNACMVQQHEMQEQHAKGRWICEKTGIWTRDGLDYFSADGEVIPTPDSVTFHIWTAYSPFTTWGRIVLDFYKAKDDRNKLKTFINTTLGETFDEDEGDKVEWETLYGRREVYPQIPARAVALMGGIDTQDDRYEGRVWAFGSGEEKWLVHRFILHGDPASEELRRKVGLEIHRQFIRPDGLPMKVDRWCWDSGGHYTDEVYAESRKHGVTWVIPIRGANTYGKPIANMPRTRTKAGVYLTEVGTDNAKELIYSRLRLGVDTARSQAGDMQPGAIHFPANDDICDESELKQLTAETKRLKITGGQRVYRWEANGRRNEALDCFVYALAALRISQQRFGLNLDAIDPASPETQSNDERPRVQSSYWRK
ncbi:phage terminase large subunit family protein [Stutzerimonas frequens]|uniref:phage terminase large subunit family protein n=1 Tax=Stutzerimonas frequens TaxID=2968969 RepID=UPI00190DC4F1|nr:terminase gpA endonuclease subunit [Stutzerimonas frequens]MBK3870956.1 phage terminase large subunit family protein [Stutzerimonas frequens]MBK3909293.1 phage terminase large subunit family protein [Stutzerimonas frequens]